MSLFADHDRIARDLHDLVIQRLFAVGMTLEGARPMIVPPEVADRVGRAVDDLDATIRDIRTTIFALQAPPEQTPTLRSRVLEATDAAAEVLGFAQSVQFRGLVDTDVPQEVAAQALAVLKEGLSDAARHAHASRIEVSLDVDDHVRLIVRDNGVGISACGRRSGLLNIAERAEAMGGSAEVHATADGGTELVWAVPLDGRSPRPEVHHR